MKGRRSPDISVVLTAHDEEMLACPTLRSAGRACAAAEAEGIAVEFIAVLDDPDSATRDYFVTYAERLVGRPVQRLEVEFGDLGSSRNHGIGVAVGRHVATLDADDLWCTNWLVAAYRAAQDHPGRIAWHPEAYAFFGEIDGIQLPCDMEDRRFSILNLCMENFWGPLTFAKREIFVETTYKAVDVANTGFGYEDWAWNCDTIRHGVLHKIVPATSYFVRRKKRTQSLSQRMVAQDCLMVPSDLFRVSDSPNSGATLR